MPFRVSCDETHKLQKFDISIEHETVSREYTGCNITNSANFVWVCRRQLSLFYVFFIQNSTQVFAAFVFFFQKISSRNSSITFTLYSQVFLSFKRQNQTGKSRTTVTFTTPTRGTFMDTLILFSTVLRSPISLCERRSTSVNSRRSTSRGGVPQTMTRELSEHCWQNRFAIRKRNNFPNYEITKLRRAVRILWFGVGN